MSTLSQKLKAKMHEQHLSAHLLEKLAGLKPSVVQNILQGKSKNPTGHTLQAISQVLNCQIDELLSPEKTEQEQPSSDWNASLYQEAIQIANELFASKHLQPSKEQALGYIDEIYNYTIAGKKDSIDLQFAHWLLSKYGF